MERPDVIRRSFPKWAARFTQPAKYKCAYGGRGSSKTWTFAHILIAQGAASKLRIVCGREFQSSIAVSAKPAMEIAIRRLGLSEFYTVKENYIRGVNGTYIFFKGLERSREEIRGWEDVDRVWVEEAQRLSFKTAEILIPTMRKAASEFWFSWNPHHRTDWVWRRFILKPRPGDVIQKVNWNDNSWFPAEAEVERLSDLEDNPDQYAHIWEGYPDDSGGDSRVLPFKDLEGCVKAYRDGLAEGLGGLVEGGLDIADQGDAYNTLIIRVGPAIRYVKKWRSDDLGLTARRADGICREWGVKRLYYDAGGVGAPIRSFFNLIEDRPYAIRPELFGGTVKGGKTIYFYKLTNEQFFMRRNAQLGFGMKLRLQNTNRLLKGKPVEKDRCLFIDPECSDRLEEYLAELSQPTWQQGTTGKVELIKRDKDEPSPDLYDGSVLAFARDSTNGLTRKLSV